MQINALNIQKLGKNGQKRENKTRKKLPFFTLVKISFAKINPLKVPYEINKRQSLTRISSQIMLRDNYCLC